VEGVWEVPGECVGSAREVLVEAVLEVVGSGWEAPPGWCIYKLLYFTAFCIYTTKSSTPAISLFFLGPKPVVVYIFGVPI